MESFGDILSKCLPCTSSRSFLQSSTSPATSSIFHRNHRVSPENDTIVVDGRNIPIRTTDSKGRRLSNEILNGEINLHFVNDTEEDDDENHVVIECPTVSNFPLDNVGAGSGSNHSNRGGGSSPSRTRSPDLDIEPFETRKKRSHSIIDEKSSYSNNSYLTTIFIETDKRKFLRVVHLRPAEISEDLEGEQDYSSNDELDDEHRDQVDETGMKRNRRNSSTNAARAGTKLGRNNSSSSDDEDEYWFSKWARRPRLKKYLEEKKNAENKEAVDNLGVATENKLPEFHLQGSYKGAEATKASTTSSANGFLNNKYSLERGDGGAASFNSKSTFSDPQAQVVRFSKTQNNDVDCNLYAKNNVSLTLPLPSVTEAIAVNESTKHHVENEYKNELEKDSKNNSPCSTIKANFNLSHSTENGFTNYAFQPDSDQLNNYYNSGEQNSFNKLDNEDEENATFSDHETGPTDGEKPRANFNFDDFEESYNYSDMNMKSQTAAIKDPDDYSTQTSPLRSTGLEAPARVVSTFNETFSRNHKQVVYDSDNDNDDIVLDVDQVDLNLNINIPLTPSPSPTPSVPEKPLLFFIHGISGSSETWKSQMDYFHALGYEIVVMDLLGHGLSGTPPQAKLYHFESLVQDVITVFDHFIQDEQRQVVIVGHGYGACLATVLTRVRPKNICILVSISGGGPTPMVSSYWCDSPWFPFPCSLFPRAKKKGRFDNPDLKNIIPRNVHENILRGQIWLDGDPAFHRRITVPTLLIYGMRDKVVNLVEVCEMERTIPRAFLELIPAAGHMVMWDEPQKLNRMIRKFIQAQWS